MCTYVRDAGRAYDIDAKIANAYIWAILITQLSWALMTGQIV